MKILGVLKEGDHETRVALVPEIIAKLKAKNIGVVIESCAGALAGFLDEEYEKAGASVTKDRSAVVDKADIIVALNGLQIKDDNIAHKVVIGLFDPYFNKEAIKNLNSKQASLLSLELVPRISRAQSMDVLSSQANIAGYMAVLVAANKMTKVMPLMMTAAGTIKPAKVLVIGAGVAGLQAIATAKRLGAMVFAYDVRTVVKEQVESLGAKFLEIKIEESGEGGGGYAKALSQDSQKLQQEKLKALAKDMDVIITTAQIPGRKAPLLLDEGIFKILKKGSVIVDMASSSGGNVEGTVSNQWVCKDGVWVFGADNLARQVAKDASFTFSKNIEALLELFKDGQPDIEDEIIKEAMLCHQGKWINQTFFKSLQEG